MSGGSPERGRRAVRAAVAVALAVASVLHLWTGIADQGDFSRSTALLLEGPATSGAPRGDMPSREERLAHWTDRWVVRETPDWRWFANASSYKAVLWAQIAHQRDLAESRAYSMRVGSVPLRLVLSLSVAALVALALAEAPLWGAALFALLLAGAAIDTSFVAFLDSAYEDQVALVLLPGLALLVWRSAQRRGAARAAGAAAALAVAAFAGSSKAQLFYLPLLALPFVWGALRARWSRGVAVAIAAAAQLAACAPLVVNPYARVNVYHAAYHGLIAELDPGERATARLGGAPVMEECIGAGAWSPLGRSCVARARHGYGDVAGLALAHPRATARLLAHALVLGADVDLSYLGKCLRDAPCFASAPPFGLWRAGFRLLGPWLVLGALVISGVVGWRRGGAARATLFLGVLGATQYLVALADGLMEYPKHVLVGNFAIALSLATGVVAIACLVGARVAARRRDAQAGAGWGTTRGVAAREESEP